MQKFFVDFNVLSYIHDPIAVYFFVPKDHIFLNTGKSKRIHVIWINNPPLIFVALPDSKFAGKSIRYGKGVK